MNPKWREYLMWLALLALWTVVLVASRAAWGAPPALSYAQKEALIEAWRAGYHVGLPLAFAAVVFIESSGCQSGAGDGGLAFGCSQVHEAAAYAATGIRIPPAMLSDPNLRELNMAIGARYLEICVQRFGWPAGIGCYTTGIPRAKTKGRKYLSGLHYTHAVLAAMAWMRELPLVTE